MNWFEESILCDGVCVGCNRCSDVSLADRLNVLDDLGHIKYKPPHSGTLMNLARARNS